MESKSAKPREVILTCESNMRYTHEVNKNYWKDI